MQHVTVCDYSREWKQLYISEAEKIKNILGNELISIHHIGSTSVEGLKAKPVIDIMSVVRNISAIDIFNTSFEDLGYECMGEFGIQGRRYYRKGGDKRTHQIHIFEVSNRGDIERHLAVRDYLRSHPDIAKEYSELKSSLAERYPYNIEEYNNGKDSFVKVLERDALEWSRLIENIRYIRPFKIDDIDSVMKLWINGNLFAHHFIDKNYWIKNFESVRSAILQSDIFVYEKNNIILAFIGLTGNYIAGVFTDREYCSRGIGKALICKAKEKYPILSLHVYQKNKRAIQFYQREGFTVQKCTVDDSTGEYELTMLYSAKTNNGG